MGQANISEQYQGTDTLSQDFLFRNYDQFLSTPAQASNPCNYPAKSRGASTDFQKVDLIIDFIIALKGTVKHLTATFPYCTVCSLEKG